MSATPGPALPSEGCGIDCDWRRRCAAAVEAAPGRPRRPLLWAAGGASRPRTIGSIEPDVALALAGAGVPVRAAGDTWQIEPAASEAPDAVFRRIALALRAASLAGAWRDELLRVGDDTGVALGAIERAAVRPLGIATDALHLIVHRPDGRVWVQLRALDKATDPGCWDTTMGGLVSAGESPAEALERETWEEAGLRLAAMREVRWFGRFTARRPVPHGYMVERTELFEASVDADARPLNQDGEVERFECLDRQELVARLHAGAFTLEAALAVAMWLEHREGPRGP